MGPALLGGMLSAVAVAPPAADAALAAAVMAEVNAARTAPAAYAARLRAHRAEFARDGSYRRAGDATLYYTAEGVRAVDDAIAFMAHLAPLPPLAGSAPHRAAAGDLARDQATRNTVGHGSNDGAGPGRRVQRRGGSAYVGEVISYGEGEARAIVRQLIVDDGVPGRGHRAILFDGGYTVGGVGCGPHPAYRWMCVIDLGRPAPVATLAAAR